MPLETLPSLPMSDERHRQVVSQTQQERKNLPAHDLTPYKNKKFQCQPRKEANQTRIRKNQKYGEGKRRKNQKLNWKVPRQLKPQRSTKMPRTKERRVQRMQRRRWRATPL